MYAILVLQFGIDPEYILDRMSMYEIDTLMEYSYLKNKESWEQTRIQSYIAGQYKRTVKPQDIMPFPWDKKPEKVEDTQEERDDLMREMKEWENIMNNNNKNN